MKKIRFIQAALLLLFSASMSFAAQLKETGEPHYSAAY